MAKINEESKHQQQQQPSSPSAAFSDTDFPLAKSLSTNKVRKSSQQKMEASSVSQEEMQLLLAKLKELVPNMPRNKKLSKLEIIQYVIDYIFDLQVALESHPSSVSPMASIGHKCHSNCHSNCGHSCQAMSPSSRQPLGLLPPSVNENATKDEHMIEVKKC